MIKDHSIKISLISIVGIFISIILVVQHVDAVYGFSHGPSSCAISESFDCDKVAKSKYSMIFGVLPAASAGLFYYLLLLLTATAGVSAKEENQKKIKNILFLLSSLGLVFSAYYASISFFVLKTICIYCSSLYLINLLIWVLCFFKKDNLLLDLKDGLISFLSFFFKPFRGISPLYTIGIIIALMASLFIEGFVAWGVYTDDVTRHKVGDIVQTQTAKVIPDMSIAEEGLAQWRANPVIPNLVGKDEMWMGDNNPKATIVKFSDFQCPACKKMHFIIDELVSDFGGGILFVDKQFPLNSECNKLIKAKAHGYACQMSKAALCSGEQDAYWPATNYLYTIPLVSNSSIMDTAAKIGINEAAFEGCMKKDGFPNKIATDVQLGKQLKVRSTPTIYINGKQVKSGMPGSIVLILRELLSK